MPLGAECERRGRCGRSGRVRLERGVGIGLRRMLWRRRFATSRTANALAAGADACVVLLQDERGPADQRIEADDAPARLNSGRGEVACGEYVEARDELARGPVTHDSA